MTQAAPDIFTNVHKGIRRALFESCLALGCAGHDAARGSAARALLRDALHFIAHHGENEDVLLLPMLQQRAPAVAERIAAAHTSMNRAVATLERSVDTSSIDRLYHYACSFTALYLEHMREEELELEPTIRAALSNEELTDAGARSVARTSPADQRLMLGFMLAAMPCADVEALCARLPAAVREQLCPGSGAG